MVQLAWMTMVTLKFAVLCPAAKFDAHTRELSKEKCGRAIDQAFHERYSTKYC